MKNLFDTSRTVIIAEAGVNHNNDIEIAKEMIDVAVDAGADMVKFQTFSASNLVTRSAPKAPYQNSTTLSSESHLEMLKKLELSERSHRLLQEYCTVRGIVFLSSPFDLQSIDFLADLGLEIIKVPSGEITNTPYLRKIGSLTKKIILSSGMSTLDEIEYALSVLIEYGTTKDDIVVLHCTSAYPTPIGEVNLRAMCQIRDKCSVRVGYSDHTLGIEVPIAAVALGAQVIEKHFTLSRGMRGPDHKASLEPDELREMVRTVRNVEKALGNSSKIIFPSEEKNRLVARKSISALMNIKKGDIFSEKNITTKRPGSGLDPRQWDRVIGRIAARDIPLDELIVWSDVDDV